MEAASLGNNSMLCQKIIIIWENKLDKSIEIYWMHIIEIMSISTYGLFYAAWTSFSYSSWTMRVNFKYR